MKISLLALSAVMASKNNNRAGYTKLGIFMFCCNHVTFTNCKLQYFVHFQKKMQVI